ncbi:hypothetical protein Ahy_B06g082910 [Arachis hypogaea]|uniref:Uncharacterized protein n=1 Tax=Arachis hypogaea TaxID=3818 RepID=A0A444YP11_ARAHY|nr:hypothetical protein Ahy_B06g082910 [Arachis hypogaea]
MNSGMSLAILRYKDQFKEAVFLAFDSPSWKDLKSFSSFIMAILSRPLFEEFEKSTSSDKDTCNFGFEYTLKKSPYKLSPGEKFAVLEDLQGNAKSSLEEALTHTFNG